MDELLKQLIELTKEQSSTLFKIMIALDNILMYQKPSEELITGQTKVTTAGTAIQLITGIVPCRRVIIQAFFQNTDNVAIGRQGVLVSSGSVTSGITDVGRTLAPGQAEILYINDASLLWVNSAVNNEGVNYVIEKDYN